MARRPSCERFIIRPLAVASGGPRHGTGWASTGGHGACKRAIGLGRVFTGRAGWIQHSRVAQGRDWLVTSRARRTLYMCCPHAALPGWHLDLRVRPPRRSVGRRSATWGPSVCRGREGHKASKDESCDEHYSSMTQQPTRHDDLRRSRGDTSAYLDRFAPTCRICQPLWPGLRQVNGWAQVSLRLLRPGDCLGDSFSLEPAEWILRW